MTQSLIQIGPADHGRRISLADFDLAEPLEGRTYELGRGVVTVVDVPNTRHLAQVRLIQKLLTAYDLAHPGRIHTIAGGGECKILVPSAESERHPDVAVYKTPPPEEDVWSTWVPEIVIEVVSPGSEQRDYVEKPEEYLAFGSAEYWVFDADRSEAGELLVHRRRAGRWATTILRPPAVLRTRQLPGLGLDVAAVFATARSAV